jgi:hypothetical protein
MNVVERREHGDELAPPCSLRRRATARIFALPRRDRARRIGQPRDRGERHDDPAAVPVGMDEIAVLTFMPATVTGRSNASTCAYACEGPTLPASTWKPGAHCGRSRIEPLVTRPTAPRPRWIADCTSPQNAPAPASSASRSSITDERRLAARVDEAVIAVAAAAQLVGRQRRLVPRADGRGAREADHRWRVGKPHTSGRSV